MFCVFSYLAPTMTQVTGLPESWIPFGLVAFGVGSIIGTLGGGWLYDRLGFRSVAVVLAWSVVVLLVFPLAAQAAWSLLVVVVAVGTMGALATILQAHLMAVAAGAQTLAAASNHSAFNAANALGPWLGGMRSEEHTSELQSLMRISYAVFCLKKKKKTIIHSKNQQNKNR